MSQKLTNHELVALRTDLKTTALWLYDRGFNVVPVRGKEPIGSWSPDRRIPKGELEKRLESDELTGIAIVGGEIENEKAKDLIAVLIDVDNPLILQKSPKLAELLAKTTVWKTGLKCPKCGNKALENGESVFKCKTCGETFTLDKALRGYGALVFVKKEDNLKLGTKRDLRVVEILVNNYQLIPPSLHPNGVQYEWVRGFHEITAISHAELENILKEVEKVVKGEKSKETQEKDQTGKKDLERLRELGDSEMIKLKELLKPAYKAGVRQYIWLFLSGWGAKARISPLSIARVLKMLYDETKDDDSMRMRAGALVYSYKKAGVDISACAQALRELFGVDPYGLEREFSEEQVKGKGGLQETLEEAIGEEKALETIKEIEEIFKVASPFKDSIIELLDYDQKLYAIVNLKKLLVVRGKQGKDALVYKEKVAIGAPTELTVYVNPVGGITKYKVKWECANRPKPLLIGPAFFEEIVDRLKAEGLVLHSRLINDIMAAVFEGFIRKGKAEIKEEIESPGFYLIEGKLTPVGVEIRSPSSEELKEAITLLNELADWYKHVIDKFAMIVKWGAISPFLFVMKQKGKWVEWLYLYGASKTGKTTLGEIVLAIWGLDSRYVKTGASIDTIARIGHVLSQSTFPILINEPGNAIQKEEIMELLKNAVGSPLARGKYVRGSYVEIPALSPFIFASNKVLPKDDALARRFIKLTFTYGERISKEKAKEFEEGVKPRLKKLKALGDYIALRVINEPALLERPWEELARTLLSEAYQSAGLEPPEWLNLSMGSDENELYENVTEAIRTHLVKRINEEYSRHIHKLIVDRPDGMFDYLPRAEAKFDERVKIVLGHNLLPWAMTKGDHVYITSGILEELRHILGDTSLKSLAELLMWEYAPKKSFRSANEVVNKSVIEVDMEKFILFLNPISDFEDSEDSENFVDLQL